MSLLHSPVISTRLAQPCCKNIVPCLSHAQKMTTDQHELGIGFEHAGFWYLDGLGFHFYLTKFGIGVTGKFAYNNSSSHRKQTC